MKALLEVLYEDPSLHHLIIERIIHNYSKAARDFRHDMVFGACDQLASIIEEGVASGELRKVDPRHLFLAMIGACSFPMGERALFDELMGKEATRAHLEAYAEFVTEMFINGLAGPAEQAQTRARAAARARQFLTIPSSGKYPPCRAAHQITCVAGRRTSHGTQTNRYFGVAASRYRE